MTEVAALETIAEVGPRSYASPTQGHTLRTVCRVVRKRESSAPRRRNSRGEGDTHGTGSTCSQRAGTDGTVVSLGKVTRIGACQPDARDGQGASATISQRHRLGSAARAHILRVKAQAWWTQTHRRCRRDARSAQSHTLRTARRVVSNRETGALHRCHRRREGHADSAGSS